MQHNSTILLWVLISFVTAGCSIFNPYEEDFACHAGKETGKCVTIKDAYEESLQGKTQSKVTNDRLEVTRRGRLIKKNKTGKVKKEKNESKTGEPFRDVEVTYQERAFEKLSRMLEKPKTPLMSPPVTIRVLFLPYKDEANRLYMSRYVYLIVDQAQWVIGGSSPEGVQTPWDY